MSTAGISYAFVKSVKQIFTSEQSEFIRGEDFPSSLMKWTIQCKE